MNNGLDPVDVDGDDDEAEVLPWVTARGTVIQP
jgi:hypothetical protein